MFFEKRYPFGSIMPGRSYTGNGYRYGFNGKEKDDEVKGGGNSLDFGARVYDSRLGRFLSRDKLGMIRADLSPYNICDNSPIRYIDFNGNFKIDAFFAKNYPALTTLLMYYLPHLKHNSAVRDAWVRATKLPYNEFDKMIMWGNGPWVTPTRPEDDPKNSAQTELPFGDGIGRFTDDWKENLFIGQGTLLKLEEAAKTALSTGNADELAFQMFHISVIILHEATHYGAYKRYGNLVAADYTINGTEKGSEWELIAFGKQFSYGPSHDLNIDYTRMKDFFNMQDKDVFNNSSMMGLTLWEKGMNSYLFRFGSKGAGQVGDPSLEKHPPSKRSKPKNKSQEDSYLFNPRF